MKITLRLSFVKKALKICVTSFMLTLLLHEVITNRNILQKDILFVKDFHNITSTVLVSGFITYTGAVLQNSIFYQSGFVVSLGITWAVVEMLKNILKKERPDKSDRKSFPSGHMATGFVCFFWVLMSLYRKNFFFIIPAIIIGALRILAYKHDIFDVSAGALIALGISFVTYKIGIALDRSGLIQKLVILK